MRADALRRLQEHKLLHARAFEFDECELLLPFIEAGKAVFGVEYNLPAGAFCADANAIGFSWLKKDLDLTADVEFCLLY